VTLSVLDHVFPVLNDLTLGPAVEPIRERVTAGARGRVLEIGAGTGLNFRHYAPGVEVVAIEPGAGMRARAARRARGAAASIEVADGRAHKLPFEDASFDAVVATFVLCSVRHLDATLAELRRVLRPGGALHVAEHVLSPDAALARWQRRVQPVWGVVFGGCRLDRDVAGALGRAGFEIDELEAVELPLPTIARPGTVGVARRR
jgi:SAM-dependent methyltransferase